MSANYAQVRRISWFSKLLLLNIFNFASNEDYGRPSLLFIKFNKPLPWKIDTLKTNYNYLFHPFIPLCQLWSSVWLISLRLLIILFVLIGSWLNSTWFQPLTVYLTGTMSVDPWIWSLKSNVNVNLHHNHNHHMLVAVAEFACTCCALVGLCCTSKGLLWLRSPPDLSYAIPATLVRAMFWFLSF